MKLYEITEGYQRVLDLMEEEGGDFTKALDDLAEAFNEKAENVAKVVRNLEAEAEVFANESQRMAQKATARKNQTAHLKDYLKGAMEQMGIENIKGQLLNVGLQNSTPTCEVLVAVEELPEEFVRVIPEKKEADKKALMAYYKEKGEVPDGVEVRQGRHIRIR